MHSFCAKGNLKQLANLISQPRLPKNIKNDFRAVKDLFGVIYDAHITAVVLNFFAIEKVADTSTKHGYSGNLNEVSAGGKRKYLSKCLN